MKKLTYAIALSTLLLAGCSQEDGIMESKGELVTLNYNINLNDGVQSRAGNEQVVVNKLYCAIYEVENKKIDGNEKTYYNYVRTDKVDANFNNTVTYTPALFKNLEYKIIFWAQYEETGKDPYYNLSDNAGNNTLLAITVNNNADVTNVYNSFPQKDAFTAISGKAKGSITASNGGSVTLTRPFSQVNVYTLEDDWTQAVALNRIPTSSTIMINCQTTYNAMTQEWEGNAIDLEITSTPSYDQKFTYTNGTDDTSDDWNCCTLFSEYVFASCGDNVNCYLKIFDNVSTPICEEEIPNFPLLINKRTNVIGRIMTGVVEYNVSTGTWGDDKNINPDGTEM